MISTVGRRVRTPWARFENVCCGVKAFWRLYHRLEVARVLCEHAPQGLALQRP